jgi:voltage-gated potassium channel
MFHVFRRFKKYVLQHRPAGVVILAAVAFALAYGTLGFHFLEQQSWEDAVYWTVTTMSTVGYGDLSPASGWGRLHAMFLMVMGIGIFGLVVESFISLLLEISERRRRGMIKVKQQQHILICGWSETIREVIIECGKSEVDIFVLSADGEVRDELEALGATFVKGDPTRWEDLERAGVERAGLVIIDLPTDSESLDCLITVRGRTQARIIVEVERAENQPKFESAGADEMTIPFVLSGRLIAQSRTKRYITRFVTEVISTGIGMSLEEVVVHQGEPVCGKTLADLASDRFMADAQVVAVGRGGELLIDTSGKLTIEPDDHLLCLKQGS